MPESPSDNVAPPCAGQTCTWEFTGDEWIVVASNCRGNCVCLEPVSLPEGEQSASVNGGAGRNRTWSDAQITKAAKILGEKFGSVFERKLAMTPGRAADDASSAPGDQYILPCVVPVTS